MALVTCRECGRSVSTEAPRCPHCGCDQPAHGAAPAPGAPPGDPTLSAMPPPVSAPPAPGLPTAGAYGVSPYPSGNDAAMLPHVQGGNLGAFWFSWIWAFSHRLTGWGIAILVISFIPYVSIINLGLAIYIGIKGNELAWERRPFRDVEDFRACQRVWRSWAIGFIIATVAIVVLAIIFIAFAAVAQNV